MLENCLAGKIALITGGGSGIGRATARILGEYGAKVAVTELPGRTHLADTLVDELRARGVDALSLTLDLNATLTIPHIVAQVIKTFGGLHILINNAGVQLFKPALDIDEDELDSILNVNLKGSFLCAQAAGAVMVEQRSGSIVNVASQHGVVGNHNRAPYCASKGGLINLTRALAVEWGKFGVRVNAISPTFVLNESNRALLDSAEVSDEISRGTLLGKAASVDDVAWGIFYLVSPMANMVTGHNLMVDGGWTAQ